MNLQERGTLNFRTPQFGGLGGGAGDNFGLLNHPLSAIVGFGVEGIAQAVPQQIAAQHN
jgi:hypothetical protein